MKILYVSQYYPPEIGAPSARVSELSREWAKRGHDVTVLTAFPHHPHGVKRPEDRWTLTRRETDPVEPTVTVVRTYVYAARNAGFLWRTLSYVSFMLSAVFVGLFRVGRPDVVVATSPQLFTAVAGWCLARLMGVPWVFEVRDLWPESIVTVGAMKEGFLVTRLKGLAAFLYRAADGIVTVGDGYRRRILQDYAVDPAKFAVVTNGVDLGRFRFDQAERDTVRTTRGWSEETVALYLGTHGMAHGLDFVLEAAHRLRDAVVDGRRLRFVFVGDGAEKASLERQARERGLANVTFLPQQGKDAVVGLYAAADVCLVPLRKVDLFRDVLPSKLFEIMGMERAILLSVDGDARAEVERAGAGLFVEPENIDALVD
ncbi:MAG: glycosyltransferase family 4 protein, partial [Planctomycetia bacterium]